MSSHRRLVGLGLGAVLAAVIATPAGADVKTVQVKAQVKFLEVNRDTFMEFTAKIAARPPCRGDRRANLWYKPDEDAEPEKVGSDRSNRKGRFTFELDEMAIAGLYAIQLPKDVEREDGTKFVCKAVKPVFYRY
jgi:hypothetical protein